MTITKRYRTQWRAKEAIRLALREGTLVSWYGTDHYFVLVLKRS